MEQSFTFIGEKLVIKQLFMKLKHEIENSNDLKEHFKDLIERNKLFDNLLVFLLERPQSFRIKVFNKSSTLKNIVFTSSSDSVPNEYSFDIFSLNEGNFIEMNSQTFEQIFKVSGDLKEHLEQNLRRNQLFDTLLAFLFEKPQTFWVQESNKSTNPNDIVFITLADDISDDYRFEAFSLNKGAKVACCFVDKKGDIDFQSNGYDNYYTNEYLPGYSVPRYQMAIGLGFGTILIQTIIAYFRENGVFDKLTGTVMNEVDKNIPIKQNFYEKNGFDFSENKYRKISLKI